VVGHHDLDTVGRAPGQVRGHLWPAGRPATDEQLNSRDASFRRRWQTPEGRDLAAQVLDALARKRVGIRRRRLDQLPLGRHDGRIDVRGLEVPDPQVGGSYRVGGLQFTETYGVPELHRLSLEGVDFTGARLSHVRMRNCRFVNCVFDRASCRGWRLWDCTIEECSFRGADLRESALGPWPHGVNTWANDDFSGADLRELVIKGANFEQCDFSESRLDGAELHQCTIRGCRFQGRMERVIFEGRELPARPFPVEIEVDFSHAYFADVEFRGYSLEKCVLPRDDDVFLVPRYPCVGRRVVELADQDGSELGRRLSAVIPNSLRGPGPTGGLKASSADVFNRRDWRAWGGEAYCELAERLVRQAMTECSGPE
jgi:uncharacterized protein YjbI with pentapeptide repeats